MRVQELRRFATRLPARRACLSALACLALLYIAPPPASASASPWWHLGQGTRPAQPSPGFARDEVQRLTVSATGGTFVLLDEQRAEYRIFPWNATAAEVQAGLEGIFGAGNVEVSGGPGDELAGAPYLIAFRNQLAAQPLALLDAELSALSLTCEGAGPGCSASADVTELTRGRPDLELVLSATNLGDDATAPGGGPLRIVDLLPSGTTPVYASALAGQLHAEPGAFSTQCSLQPDRASCEIEGAIVPYDRIEVRIGLLLEPGYSPSGQNRISLSAPGAPPATLERSFGPLGGPAGFGLEEFDLRPEAPGGQPADRAGSHPFQVTTAFAYRQSAAALPLELPKDIRLELPPGLLANAASAPVCPVPRFHAGSCPQPSVVGVATFTVNDLGALGLRTVVAPIYSVDPRVGRPARFAMAPIDVPVFIDVSLKAADRHAATLSIANITQAVGVLGGTITLWGVPGDPRHDDARGEGCLFAARGDKEASCQRLADPDPEALLTLPPTCGEPLWSRIEANSWSERSVFVAATQPFPTLHGCNRLPFSPILHAAPTSGAARSPSGLALDFSAPLAGFDSPSALAEAPLAAARLRLPPGLSVNPPAASGLSACTPAQLATELSDTDPATGCPAAAKLGTATLSTPLFAEPIAGALYAAQPDDPRTAQPGAENPFDSLLALYLILRDPRRGILLSQPIRLDADPSTGRLDALLEKLPALPFERLQLRLNSGPHAPLSTPAECGTHTITYSLTPSSGNLVLAGSDAFSIDSGCGAAFAPTLQAGTTTYAAASQAPFVLELEAPAAASNLAGLSLTLPPGLAANLNAAATCPEIQAATAACPPDSRLGFARIALGAGPEPLWVPAGADPDSDVFLAGPYRGAPYSLLISVPAIAGPYDLGPLVLRAPVRVDPLSAQLSVEVTELPRIRAGIPLHYRALRLVLDRPGFIRNPTSCEPSRIDALAHAFDGTSVPLSAHFQAADCAALPFRPRLALHLSGALGRGGHPRIRVELAQRGGEADLAAAALTLPAGQLLDIRRIRALCPRESAPPRCPASSRLGRAILRSPFLPAALAGPIFLRRPARRFPTLTAELRGGGLSFILKGRTEAAPGGRLRLRLAGLPDLPLSRATIEIAGGKRGIFVNSERLCSGPRRALVMLNAHNGKQQLLRPRLRLGGRCR